MSVLNNYQCEGQLSIFDVYGLDTLYGRTLTEQEVRDHRRERISALSSRKSAKSQTKTPQFLDLRGGKDGKNADVSWEMGTVLLGDCMTHSSTEFRNAGEDYVYLLTSTEIPHQEWYLNCSEKPFRPIPSKLSEILEQNPDPKYNLSPRACLGILRRAEKRGKELPQMLKEALIRQSAFLNEQVVQGGGKGILIQNEKTGTLSTLNNQSVVYGISGYESNAMKSSNPHSGIYEADTTRTLDLNGGNPACNQGGMMVLESGCNWDGTQTSPTLTANNANGAQRMPDKDNFNAVITYGLDRASFNQGQNAQYDFSIKEEMAQTLGSKGPGGAAVIKQ